MGNRQWLQLLFLHDMTIDRYDIPITFHNKRTLFSFQEDTTPVTANGGRRWGIWFAFYTLWG